MTFFMKHAHGTKVVKVLFLYVHLHIISLDIAGNWRAMKSKDCRLYKK